MESATKEHLAFLSPKDGASVRLAAWAFVLAYEGGWKHADWEHFLAEVVAATGNDALAKDPSHKDALGLYLEELKAIYLQQGREAFVAKMEEVRHAASRWGRLPTWAEEAGAALRRFGKAFTSWLSHLWTAELKAESLPRSIPLPVRGLLGTLFPVIKVKYILVLLGAVIVGAWGANALRYRSVVKALEARRFEVALEAASRLESTFSSRLHAYNPLEAFWLRPAFRRLKDEQVAFAAYQVGELARLAKRTALFTELPDVLLLDLALEEHQDELRWNDRPTPASRLTGGEPGLALFSDDGALQTILLEVWVWRALRQRPHPRFGMIPVVVSLSDFVGDAPELSKHIVATIRATIRANRAGLTEEVVRARAARGGFLIALTHLESSGDPVRTAGAVRTLVSDPLWQSNRWWVGYRIDSSRRALRPSLSPLAEAWVASFQEAEAAEVVREAFPGAGEAAVAELRSAPRLAQALRNPLVMAMFLKHYRRYRTVPAHLGSFYRAVVMDALASSGVESSGEGALAPQAKELLLGTMAESMSPERESLPRFEAEAALAETLGFSGGLSVAGANKASLALETLLQTPLLITDASLSSWSASFDVRFLLPSFRDYFRATAAARRLPSAERRGGAEAELAPFLDDPTLEPSASFLVGLLDDATVVFDLLLARARQAKVDAFPTTSRRYLRLAARLLQSAVAVDEATVRELTAALVAEAQGAQEKSDRRRALEALGYIRRPAAFQALLEALRDPDPEVRQSAVVGLERHSGANIVPPLVAALRDDDSSVQARAVAALSLAPREHVVPALESLIAEGTPSLRARVVNALAQVGGSEAAAVLERAAADEDRFVRRLAVRSLGKLALQGSRPALVRALKDEDAAVRAESASALGALKSPEAVPALAELLRDEAYRVKEAAANALGDIGSEEAVSTLEQALSRSTVVEQRAFVQALGKVGRPRAYEVLQRVVARGEPAVQTAAIQALGRMGGPRSVEVLVQSLRDMDPSVQREAVITLRHLRDRRASRTLVELIKSPDPLVRAEALMGVGELGDVSALEAVVGAAADESVEVRQAAATVLGRLGGKKAGQPLARLASDEDPQVRAAAIEALAARSNTVYSELFLRALGDPDPGVRNSAAAALERDPSSQAVSALVGRADDPDPFARREIVRVLGVVGGREAMPALLARLVEGDPSIRAEAARSLRRMGPVPLPSLEALLANQTPSEQVREEVYNLSVVMESKINWNDLNQLSAVAEEYAGKGRWQRALTVYSRALALAKTPRQRAQLHAAVGEARASLGEVKAAREAYLKALKEDPSNRRAGEAIRAMEIETAQGPVKKRLP